MRPKNYGSEKYRGHRYVLVTIDNLSKFVWTVLLKNRNAQTKKDCFETFLKKSKRKPILIESDRGKENYNNIFESFLDKNNIKHYSINSSLGAAFAEHFNRTIRDLLERPIFEKGYGNWIDIEVIQLYFNTTT